MSRLRGGELLALGGGVLLLVALFLPWIGVDADAVRSLLDLGDEWTGFAPLGAYEADGWTALGWLVLAVAAAAIASVIWLGVANVTRWPVAHTVAANVIAAVLGLIAVLVLAARALVFQPGPNELVDLRYGAWLGLAGALALTVGAWWALADERTSARESAYEPPPARPAPPERAS